MINWTKELKLYQLGITLILLSSVVLSIYPPHTYWFQNFWANFTPQVMLILFGLSFVFLFAREQKLMTISFICCAALCIFLKKSNSKDIFEPIYTTKSNQELTLRIAHFNLSHLEGEYEEFLDALRKSDADLVSIQEITPDWLPILESALKKEYPTREFYPNIDFSGIGLLSRFPLKYSDTIKLGGITNIFGKIQPDSVYAPLHFIMSHTTPNVSSKAREQISNHLLELAKFTRKISGPILTIGEYNCVPWSREVQMFRDLASLNDSRRDLVGGIFQVPLNHIFYSDHLECLKFKEIGSSRIDHLGILGKYQYKKNTYNAKGTASQF